MRQRRIADHGERAALVLLGTGLIGRVIFTG